jgi:hypothetical protein
VLVAHAYNPSYSGGLQFEASLGKQFMRPYLQKKKKKKSQKGLWTGSSSKSTRLASIEAMSSNPSAKEEKKK